MTAIIGNILWAIWFVVTQVAAFFAGGDKE